MKLLARSLAALVLGLVLEAQSAPPPAATPRPPWQPRPVIIIDPNAVLTSPTPHASLPPGHRAALRTAKPRPHPTPAHRFSAKSPPPELFERYDTRPSASPRPRG